MQITLELNKELLESVVEKGISGLTENELKEILTKVIYEYLDKSDVIKDLLIDEHTKGYGSKEPSEFLKNLVNSVDLTELINKLSGIIEEYIVNNLTDIISDILKDMILGNLFSHDVMKRYVTEAFDKLHTESHKGK